MMWTLFSVALANTPEEPFARCLAQGALDLFGEQEGRDAVRASFASPDRAESLLDGLIARFPRCAGLWTARAATRHARGDDQGALADLRIARDTDPGSVHAQRALAVALHRAGGGRAALDEAVLAAPDDGLLKVLQARERPVSERPELLVAAVRAHPDDPAVARAAVDALVEAGRPLEGIALGRELLTHRADPELAARIDALERPFAGPAERRIQRPGAPDPTSVSGNPIDGEYREVDDADLEVVVYSPERARLELERRLTEMGWTDAEPIPGGMRYRSEKPVQPYVDVLDAGEVIVQTSGLVKPAPLSDGSTMIPAISARKLRPDRIRVMEDIAYEVSVWRNALVQQTFQREVDAGFGERLTRLWEEGRPLYGDGAPIPADARRAALLEHWATRVCSPDGELVRAAVARFLRNVVQEGPDPVTDAERRAAEAACPCEGVTLDLDGSAGTP